MIRRGNRRALRGAIAVGLCGLVLLCAALARAAGSAPTCSCVLPDPWKLLPQADGAFVGRLVSRRVSGGGQTATLLFDVERAVKGDIGATVEVETPASGAACGIETEVGRRIGLFLERRSTAWHGLLCWQTAPEELLAALTLTAPNGAGPAAVLAGGRFGPARSQTLDAQGRTLAYGLGSATPSAFSACPSGRRVAEITNVEGGFVVTVRELLTMQLVRRQRIPAGARASRPHCASVDADRLLVFVGPGSDLGGRARLLRVTPGETATIWEGVASSASFRRNRAFVQVRAAAGTSLVAVDARTGSATTLVTLPFRISALAPNAAGTRFAGVSAPDPGACCARLLVVDGTRRPATVTRAPLPVPLRGMLWASRERLVLLGRSGEALVYTKTLRPVGRIRGWNAARGTAASESKLFGLRADGALIVAAVRPGRAVVLRRLPATATSIGSTTF